MPAALTGVAALAGLLGGETDAPCGKFCPEASPDPSTKAWFVAPVYVGLIAVLCFGRVLAASDLAPATMPSYRGGLG